MPRGIRRGGGDTEKEGFGPNDDSTPSTPPPFHFLPNLSLFPPSLFFFLLCLLLLQQWWWWWMLTKITQTFSPPLAGRICPMSQVYSLSAPFPFFLLPPPTFLSIFSFHPPIQHVFVVFVIIFACVICGLVYNI